MIIALAAFLLQLPAVPEQLSSKQLVLTAKANEAASSEPAAKETGSPTSEANPAEPAATAPIKLISTEGLILNSNLPARDSRLAARSLSPRSRFQDDFEEPPRRNWFMLAMAEHGAAAFDAWSTRQAISTGRYREANPTLRPFADNASLYAAIQVGPLAFDYVGRRMMRSQHRWMRSAWWIPQALSTAFSLGSGAYNLSAH